MKKIYVTRETERNEVSFYSNARQFINYCAVLELL